MEKDDFCHENFKLVHAPTLNISHYMVRDVFIYTQLETFCLVRNIVLEKDDFFMKYFKLVHAQTLKIPLYMKGFLFMCTRHETFGTSNFFALSATPQCFARYSFWKRVIFNEIFQVGPCPNLKYSSLYERFSIHMNKA